MASLHQSVAWADMQIMRIQIDPQTKDLRTVSLVEAAAKKHGPTCKCEACSALHMQRTRDKRMKAMMPGNVDMGNRQPATMGKAKANSALMMKKQVAPPKEQVEKIKPSNLMHEKGKILKGKEFSQPKRNKLAKQKKALPDGSFPIENKDDLDNAKHALGRAKNIPKARTWINKRAKQLKAPGLGD